jgi:protein-ribulosamine 3-kinase
MLSAVPLLIRQRVAEIVRGDLTGFSFCAGGCINHGGKLNTSAGDLFLKWNDAEKFTGMFAAEAKGLKLLRDTHAIHVPEVVAVGGTGSWQFLLMEFIDEKPGAGRYWADLGEQLALLHRHTASAFGLDHDNYIGSLAQLNTPAEKWVDFFITQRLDVQVKLAASNGKLRPETIRQFESLYKKLPEILPEEKPSLLHGDLWSGNLITNIKGGPCLIDPAAYYGNREAEIAFTRLFGGFAAEFYDVYNTAFALQPGHAERYNIYNLYPLMVHVNLFGGGYLSQVVSILKEIV